MKQLLMIKILLLLVVSGFAQSIDLSSNQNYGKKTLIIQSGSTGQNCFFVNDIFSDDPDSNEIDGSDCVLFRLALWVQPFQTELKKIFPEKSRLISPVPNLFLLDLPPPALSK